MKNTSVYLSTITNFRTLNIIYAILLLLLVLGCKSDKPDNQYSTTLVKTNDMNGLIAMNSNVSPFVHAHPYELKLEINQLENEVYDFVISMKLNDGSYYVSPNAKRDFKGKFMVLMNDSSTLQPITKLQETPLSTEEFDPHPFVNGNVNWVRENTTYNQKFQRISENDFLITGLIQFTIEPRCTLEKIPFSIKYSNGKMKVEIDNC